MSRKTFNCCPHCGYTAANAKSKEIQAGGPRFGSNIVAIASVVTGIKAVDIQGKARAHKFSLARVAALSAMRAIEEPVTKSVTNWDVCGEAIGRDRGTAHRLFSTWRHDASVKKATAKIVKAYRTQVPA